MTKQRLWLPKLKKGALSEQLHIAEEKNIPFGLLKKINRTPIGKTIINPYSVGLPIITVTRLLKKRSVLAHTLKKMKHRSRI